MSAFIDTSAFYAAADRGDAHRERVATLLADEEHLVTSDYVVLETWLLLRRRLGYAAAERFWRGIRAGAVSAEPVTAADLDAAWSIGERFEDQGFSLTDRTSFAVMQRLGIHRAVTFDHDFTVYRFGPRQDKAFEVLG